LLIVAFDDNNNSNANGNGNSNSNYSNYSDHINNNINNINNNNHNNHNNHNNNNNHNHNHNHNYNCLVTIASSFSLFISTFYNELKYGLEINEIIQDEINNLTQTVLLEQLKPAHGNWQMLRIIRFSYTFNRHMLTYAVFKNL